MPPTADELQRDLALAVDTLVSKRRQAALYLSYYDGDNPMPVIADRLKDIFRGLKTEFKENWCAPVIDACAERITLQGFTLPNKAQQKTFDDAVTVAELLLEADDAHKFALVQGQSYIIVWRDEDSGEIEAYFHPAHQAHVFYEASRPNKKRFAAKWWKDDEGENGYTYLCLYYPDAIYEYRADTPKDVTVNGEGALKADKFELLEEMDNPYGVVPMWEFRPDRRGAISDLRNVVPLADAVNVLAINEMVISEFNAFRQKYIISSVEVAGALSVRPDTILDIPGGDGQGQDTEVGEFAETSLENYNKAIEAKIARIAAITRTPLHYFFSRGGQISGEALIALEAPLNKKAQDRIDRFTPAWRQIGAFICQLLGIPVSATEITVNFAKPETVQPKTLSEMRDNNSKAGIPIVAQLRMEGQPESVIEQVLEAKATEQAASVDTLTRAFNAGDVGGANRGATENVQVGENLS